MAMLKVAHIVSDFPSPTETFVANEAEALARLGCRVKIFAFRPPDRPVPNAPFAVAHLRSWVCDPGSSSSLGGRVWVALRSLLLRPATAAILSVSAWKARVPINILDALAQLQYHLESEPFDVVHAQFGLLGALSVPVMNRFKSLPFIVSFRGQDASALPRRQADLYAPLFRRAQRFLARSEAMKNDLIALGCPAQKLRVLHSGINLAAFPFHERTPPAAPAPWRLLLVGRLVEKKGVPDAVAAFDQARRSHPNIQLRIIGDGPLRDHIARDIAVRGLTVAVLLLGPKPHEDVQAEIAAAHLFLLPSRTAPDGDKEGIPNSIMEALASGLPVLSTVHAGIPECVEHGISGLLAPEGDIPELATHIRWALDHPHRWPAMGRAGRARIEAEFNRDVQAPRLLSVYKELL